MKKPTPKDPPKKFGCPEWQAMAGMSKSPAKLKACNENLKKALSARLAKQAERRREREAIARFRLKQAARLRKILATAACGLIKETMRAKKALRRRSGV